MTEQRQSDKADSAQEPWMDTYNRLRKRVDASQFSQPEAYNQGVWETLKTLHEAAPLPECGTLDIQNLVKELRELGRILPRTAGKTVIQRAVDALSTSGTLPQEPTAAARTTTPL